MALYIHLFKFVLHFDSVFIFLCRIYWIFTINRQFFFANFASFFGDNLNVDHIVILYIHWFIINISHSATKFLTANHILVKFSIPLFMYIVCRSHFTTGLYAKRYFKSGYFARRIHDTSVFGEFNGGKIRSNPY